MGRSINFGSINFWCPREGRMQDFLFGGETSKRSTTIGWRVAYRENFSTKNLPDGRKWHFPGLSSCIRTVHFLDPINVHLQKIVSCEEKKEQNRCGSIAAQSKV